MLLKAVITVFPCVSLPFLAVPLLSQKTDRRNQDGSGAISETEIQLFMKVRSKALSSLVLPLELCCLRQCRSLPSVCLPVVHGKGFFHLGLSTVEIVLRTVEGLVGSTKRAQAGSYRMQLIQMAEDKMRQNNDTLAAKAIIIADRNNDGRIDYPEFVSTVVRHCLSVVLPLPF
eukprot:SAG22_NODE_4684_length_1192_cov_3.906679_2_plen_173_part_00